MRRQSVCSGLLVAVTIHCAQGFVAPRPSFVAGQSGTQLNSDAGGVEQIEFKIYPDGRVEETVRGIKGNNCHKVTEKINEALGEVISSEPTEDLYEQDLVLDQTIEQTEGISNNDGSGEWGSSSW